MIAWSIKMGNNPRLILLNPETGEVVKEIFDSDKLTITSEKQQEYFKQLEKNKEFVDEFGNFIFKANTKSTLKVDNRLSHSDMARVIYLATYADYNQVLKLDSGKAMNKSELMKAMHVNKNIFYDWYNRMVKMKIILVQDDDTFTINKSYCVKGEIKRKTEYSRLFIHAVRHVYESNIGKPMNNVGAIFKLMPYIHFRDNYLCWNPKCENEEEIQYMTVSDICTGIDEYVDNPKELKRMLSRHRMDNGEPIFLFVNEGVDIREDVIMVNPRLCFSGRVEDLPITYKVFKYYNKKRISKEEKSKLLKNRAKMLL